MTKFNKTSIFIVFIVIIGTLIITNNIYNVYSSNDIDQIAEENLGMLNNKITSKEKNEIKMLLTLKTYLSESRLNQNQLEPNLLELSLSKIINDKLNNYTIKYLLNGYELEYTDDEYNLKNKTLEKLKLIVSKSDYNYLKDQIQSYESRNYESLENIQLVLEDYNLKQIDILVSYLTEGSNLELEAVFKINKNLELKYENIENITPDELSNSNLAEYKNIWKNIKHILPHYGLENFDEIYFSTDGKDNELASVAPNNEDGSRWIINIDPKDVFNEENNNYFYETIFHEYFHYMSLNSHQVVYTYDYDTENYCEEGISSKKNSYINEFYKSFWTDIIDDRNSNNDNLYFYERHKNSFVDEYASTDPSEDIAETFSYFVLEDKPTGKSVKDEKIKFFYKYKELVKLRDDLRNKINSL
ncbi:hypothetical protein [Romboutsia lituseburensis]|uniref:hypothetical protein n=1 Tax=Romboutsia lituseburensis TaxID=1537 RepID=UPI00215B4DAA|nr:hypothetical protein [Romboutsia lituseburensis]MCR8744546.1 hypothetical protein [Romboutsia lituseburensis]